MYAKKIESFNEELKEEEKRALLQAEELEKDTGSWQKILSRK